MKILFTICLSFFAGAAVQAENMDSLRLPAVIAGALAFGILVTHVGNSCEPDEFAESATA